MLFEAQGTYQLYFSVDEAPCHRPPPTPVSWKICTALFLLHLRESLKLAIAFRRSSLSLLYFSRGGVWSFCSCGTKPPTSCFALILPVLSFFFSLSFSLFLSLSFFLSLSCFLLFLYIHTFHLSLPPASFHLCLPLQVSSLSLFLILVKL